jgi:CDP-diacylglycerol--serine O-phosphatidyltransferase
MKQIPNFFTLLNLVFGCLAIVCILQPGQIIDVDPVTGAITSNAIPERITWGALFIFAAAVVDFFDGFLARLLKADSEMGKQLDSLSDVVSFGVAPGMIFYQLLRRSYSAQESGLDVTVWFLLPAFIFTCAVAWRLAKFNISTNQTNSFKGVPSPAAALVVASLPLISWNNYYNIDDQLVNSWILYAIILVLSYLMVGNQTFLAMKFKDWSLKNNGLKYLLLVVSVVAILLLKWLSVPVIFILYLVFSLFSKEPARPVGRQETLDVTV